MNEVKEYCKKTEELKNIDENIANVSLSIKKFGRFLEGNIKSLESAIRINYAQVGNAYAAIKEAMKILSNERSELQLALDSERCTISMSGKKTSRKEQQLFDAKIHYCVAIMDTEVKFNKLTETKKQTDEKIESALSQETNAK